MGKKEELIRKLQPIINDPKSFLSFCSAVCLGKMYTKTKDQQIIAILKQLANDGRWRMREAVAFGFQHIGEVRRSGTFLSPADKGFNDGIYYFRL